MQANQPEIDQACQDLNNAEKALCRAILRLRALKGEALMQSGDSFNAETLSEVMGELGMEFGSRNLRLF